MNHFQFGVISLFPEMFQAMDYGIVGRAQQNNIIDLSVWNPRDYSQNKHRHIDDRPYGGGPGMLMMAEPLAKAIEAAKESVGNSTTVVYLSPQGQPLTQSKLQQVSQQQSLILIAGRYEGVDERLIEQHVDQEWSLGDYVLSGGELATMVVIDALTRLLPGSLGSEESAQQDSFTQGLLDCPHYTRPEVYQGSAVPGVLLSGDHQAIARWRLQQALGRTWQRRPDLLQQLSLTAEQQQLLDEYINTVASTIGANHE